LIARITFVYSDDENVPSTDITLTSKRRRIGHGSAGNDRTRQYKNDRHFEEGVHLKYRKR
jgi:hypothetical protein